jgi:hypothetical protein
MKPYMHEGNYIVGFFDEKKSVHGLLGKPLNHYMSTKSEDVPHWCIHNDPVVKAHPS